MLKTFMLLFFFTLSCTTIEPKRSLSSKGTLHKFSEVIKRVDFIIQKEIPNEIKYVINTKDENGSYVEWIFDSKHFQINIGEKAFYSYDNILGSLTFVCHEFGHVALAKNDIVSSESEADYWATKVCMPNLLKQLNISKTDLNKQVFRTSCEKQFSNKESSIQCYLSLLGAYSFRVTDGHSEYINKVYFSDQDLDLTCTPFTSGKSPAMEQCGFNNLVAGALNREAPNCLNLIMVSSPFDSTGNLIYPSLSQELKKICEKFEK